MKSGGGLNYVEGPMGAGKSLYAVRRGVATMVGGGYWITNVQLLPGWSLRAARHAVPWATRRRVQRIAARLESLYVYETELAEAVKYRVPGKGEGRARFTWDEGHNDLNNRKWKDDGRAEILEWATQLRKLGFVGDLLSQHADNTDAALRRICNFRVRLQNQREQTRLLGMRITPWPLFLACWFPAHVPLNQGRRVQPVRVERYFLSWHRKLYDSWGLYHGLAAADDQDDVIWLPEPGSWRRKALPGEAGKPAPLPWPEGVPLAPEVARALSAPPTGTSDLSTVPVPRA